MKKILAALLILTGLGLAGLVARRTVENDRDYQRLIRQGDEALSRGQPYGAIEAFSAAIELKPDSMLAYLKRGEAHRRGDTPEMLRLAVVDLRKAAELDSSATRPLEELGDVDYQRSRYLNAVESYQAYLQLDDSSPEVSYKLALAARGAGDLPTAVAALQEAVRQNPSFALAHYVMGLCLKDRGQLRDAQKSFEKALAINAALIPAREEMADLHRLQGQTVEEVEQLEALAALDPSHAERLIAVGLAYSRTGNPELAVTALGRAVEKFHDYPGVYAALGEVWLETAEDRGDKAALRKALEAIEPVASQSGASSEILGLYGRALSLNGQYAEAEHAFKMASEKLPTDPAILPQLASVAQRLGHLDDARQALEKYAALVDDDHDQTAHAVQIAELSLQLNDPASAAIWYEKSAAQGEPDANLLARLADTQLQAGRVDAARQTLARAMVKDAKNPSVRAVALRIQHVTEPVPEKVESQHQ